MSKNTQGFGVDPVQLAQAMRINEQAAKIQALTEQLQFAAQTLGNLRLQMRFNECALVYELESNHEQVDPTVPNVVIPHEKLNADINNKQLGVQFTDDYDVDGVKHFALYVLRTPEQYEAAHARQRAAEQRVRDAQEKLVQPAPPGLILPSTRGNGA